MTSQTTSPADASRPTAQVLPGKQHYLTLDGLRGVAAIGVMFFHRRWWAPGGHALEHAYLAVDFFFLLSGFVIAHAYERRLSRDLSPLAFMKTRVIRLYPLIILGALLGTASYIWVGDAPAEQRWTDIMSLAVLAMLALPALPQLSTEPFALNRPVWSLFNEILVNIVYGLIARVLSTRLLLTIIIVSFGAEVVFMLQAGSLQSFGSQFDTLLHGVPRTAFPFFLGILIYRLHRQDRLPRFSIGLTALTVLLLASFAPFPLHAYEVWYELLCITLLYPLIIIAGCSYQPTGRMASAATLLANLSFPLYVLHYPLYDLLAAAATAFGITEGQPRPWYLLVISAIVLALSLVALYRYDMPVRRWLSRRYPLQSTTVRVVGARS